MRDLGCARSTGYGERTLNPEWDEVVFMGSARVSVQDVVLKLRVMDYDVIGADDDMGTAEIPLRAFARGAALDRSTRGAAAASSARRKRKKEEAKPSKPPSDEEVSDTSSSSADVHDIASHANVATANVSAGDRAEKVEGRASRPGPETVSYTHLTLPTKA